MFTAQALSLDCLRMRTFILNLDVDFVFFGWEARNARDLFCLFV